MEDDVDSRLSQIATDLLISPPRTLDWNKSSAMVKDGSGIAFRFTARDKRSEIGG